MKKILILFSAFIALTLTACLKSASTYDDFSKINPVAELPLSGKANIGADAVTLPGDTITIPFAINIATANATTAAHTITVAPDFTQVTSYNAAYPAVVYLPMPAAAFVFPSQTVTIPAGKTEAIVKVVFYKHLLDVSKSYMLPLSITSAPGLIVSGNFGTHFYHFIGNPLAGSYNHDYSRYNNTDATGPKHGTSFVGKTSIFSPVNPNQIEVTSAYYTGTVRYEVTFDSNAGIYTNFKVSLNADDVKNIFTPAGIAVTAAPTIVADPVKGVYTLSYQVQNSSGFRFLVDKFYK